MGIPPVPAQSYNICLYAAFLARSLKSSSIKQYLNIIGILHKEFGMANPLRDNWHLGSLLTGIKRVHGSAPIQKHPITLDILRGIHAHLNLTYSVDASFWAICLIAFLGMFRKSHLVIAGKGTFHSAQQFTKSDFKFFPWGVIIWVRWSKTIQFRERVVSIPLPRVPGSIFCPVAAISHAFSFTVGAPVGSQAFQWLAPSLLLREFSYGLFMSKLRACLNQCGLSGKDFGSHSFRRGGASFAFSIGVPVDLIKVLGDWKSNAVLLYLTVPLNIRIHTSTLISQHIPLL